MNTRLRWKTAGSWAIASVAEKEEPMKPFKRILVATDFSEASAPALKEAVEMAQDAGAVLLIAHAYQTPNMAQADAVAPGVYEEWDRNLRAAVETKLQPLVENAKSAGVNARALILSGAPYEAITEAAKDHKADLVIMGTHGRHGVSRFFLGSVASRVISTVACPVMTVRAAGNGAGRSGMRASQAKAEERRAR
jgi:nucleotide-binding universal stress UspA family protein